MVRAAIACHWNQPLDPGVAYPNTVISDPARGMDRRALAYVVQGVLDLAGVRLDHEDRSAPLRGTVKGNVSRLRIKTK